jgi:hypothetical protein
MDADRHWACPLAAILAALGDARADWYSDR